MMRRILLATTAVLAVTAAAARAETAVEQVIAGLQAQGFTDIEVTTGPNQVKVEASGGGRELEYVYDRLTGEVLMQEAGIDEDADDEAPAVEVETSDEDFLDSDEDDEAEEREEEEREEREEREEEEREEREDRDEEEREEREEREEEEREEREDRDEDEDDED